MGAKKDLIRVNTRISNTANDWLDNYSNSTGLPKSAIIMMAIENFIREQTAISSMGHMAEQIKELKALIESKN